MRRLPLFCMEKTMTAQDNAAANSPFNTAALPAGTPQGQQQTLAQSTQTNSTQANSLETPAPSSNVGETTHFGF